MKLRIAALLLPALIAFGCGSAQPTTSPTAPVGATPSPAATPTPTTPPTTSVTQPPVTPTALPTPAPSPTAAPAGLLLEVTQEGGFIAPSARIGELPSVVVDMAGNIYTPSLSTTPALLIPAVDVRNVGVDGAGQILAAMKAAGLDRAGDDGGPGNPDAGVTVFTAEIDGQEIVNRVSPGGPGGPGHPGASSSPALDLMQRLLDQTETWGATDMTTSTYMPTAYKVYVAPATADSGSTSDWPLTSLANFGSPATPDFGVAGLRTGAVSGADATKLATGLASAPMGTLVVSDDKTYQVWIRPLLPPELA